MQGIHGSPWLYMCSHGHQMITQQKPKCPEAQSKIAGKGAFFTQHTKAIFRANIHFAWELKLGKS